jgi:hypothetical protein
MENKHDLIFDIVVAPCRAKHLRDVMTFRKNWKNKVIAQFFATLFVEEHGDTSKLHWMAEAQWFKVFYAKFARLFGFGRNDANRIKIHLPLKRKEAKKMIKKSYRSSYGETLVGPKPKRSTK